MVSMRPPELGFDRVSAVGRFTVIPDCIMGAVIMKMIRSTSMTSTSGVTLISDRLEVRRLPFECDPCTCILL